jgi:hypothetical protein
MLTVSFLQHHSHQLRRISMVATLLAMLCGLGNWGASAQAQSGITSPATGATVGGDVPIFGTAVIEPFQKYELHYKQEPSGDDAYIYFGGGTTPVQNGQLGIWQAGGLSGGVYSLRLRVVKADGNYAEFYAQSLSVNQGPTPTPTSSEPTETPIPTLTYTPAPQPTPVVGAVQQPQVEGELAVPTATPAPVTAVDTGATTTNTGALDGADQAPALSAIVAPTEAGASESAGIAGDLGEALAFEKLRARFWSGVRYSAAICIGILALLGGKRLFGWAWTQFR